MSRWDQLPVDLLRKVDVHIELYDDKVRSKCVCTHWERAFPELSNVRQPLMLLPFTGGSLCGLFHPFEKKLLVIDLPEVGEEKVFKGSDQGWVVTAQQNGSINVVNPLTREKFALPPRYKFPDVLKYRPDKVGNEYLFRKYGKRRNDPRYPPESLDSMHVRNYKIYKIAFSGAPTSNVFIAVCLHGSWRRLAYCKPGDNKWTDLIESDSTVGYRDFTFCGGKLYGLTCRRELMVCDDIITCPVLRKLLPTWEGFGLVNTDIHLINSSDNGIMVIRRKESVSKVQELKKVIFRTYDFEIYKLDLSGQGWIRMESLGQDEILFMGLGTQFGIRGIDGNRIYFSDDNLPFNSQDIEDCLDNGIFRFEDKKVEPLGYKFDSRMIFPSPIWVVPNVVENARH